MNEKKLERDDLLLGIEKNAGQILDHEHPWTVARYDGKGFSQLTKQYARPFDPVIGDAMIQACLAIAQEMAPRFIYTTSDEISVFWHTNRAANQHPPFGNKQQKIVSIGAAAATAGFLSSHKPVKAPLFDGRAMTFVDNNLTLQYLRSRQMSGKTNSVASLAQEHFSHTELNKVGIGKMLEMLEGTERPWESMPAQYRYGLVFFREMFTVPALDGGTADRHRWACRSAKDFDFTTVGLAVDENDVPPAYMPDGIPQWTPSQFKLVADKVREIFGVELQHPSKDFRSLSDVWWYRIPFSGEIDEAFALREKFDDWCISDMPPELFRYAMVDFVFNKEL